MMVLHITVAVACAASALLIPVSYYLDRRIAKKVSLWWHAISGASFIANAGLAIYHTVKAFEAAL